MATSKTRKRFSWLISLIVMLAASAALIFASDRVTAAVYGPYQESQPVPTVASMTEMDISGYAADDYQVEMVQTCLDESGAVVGYAVDTWEYGFNSEKPIHLRSTISTDGKLLISVEVLEQHESDYYGDQIGEDWYPGRLTVVSYRYCLAANLDAAPILTEFPALPIPATQFCVQSTTPAGLSPSS